MSMKHKLIYIALLIPLILLGIGFLYIKITTKRLYQPEITIKDWHRFNMWNNNFVLVDIPTPGATVVSPLLIVGRAKGNMYFEGSFPVKLLDADGTVIASGAAQAQGDWMTEEFVPFKAELIFTPPGGTTGKLVLEKDNPSGLPEKAAKFEVLVKF